MSMQFSLWQNLLLGLAISKATFNLEQLQDSPPSLAYTVKAWVRSLSEILDRSRCKIDYCFQAYLLLYRNSGSVFFFEYRANLKSHQILGTVSLGTGVLTDIVTATALCYYLNKLRTGHEKYVYASFRRLELLTIVSVLILWSDVWVDMP